MNRLRVSRRALLAGAGAGVMTGGIEWLSLRGSFDHRRSLGASAADRYAASLRSLDEARSRGPSLIHVGHSSHVIAIGGLRILTDPWFYDPAFGALSHEVAPAVAPSALGHLDAILVTHDHADHADLRAMSEMDKGAHVLTSTADLAARIEARGFRRVTVLSPWEERTLGEVTITAVPAEHDIYEIGFVLRAGDDRVYFAGDTRLHADMATIAARCRPTMAILPVDGTRLVTAAHLHVMTPDDAVVAAGVLGAKIVVPSHAEAYFSDALAGHVLASTIPRARQSFAELMAKRLPKAQCRVPLPGELVAL